MEVKNIHNLSKEEEIIYKIVNNIDCSKELNSGTIDFDKLKSIISEQKIFPYVYDCLKKVLCKEDLKELQNEAQRLKIKNTVSLHQMNLITKAFKDKNISFAFSKGLISSYFVYDNPLLRDMNDIDLVVSSKDYLDSCAILEALGYREVNYDLMVEQNDIICDKDEYYRLNINNCTFCKNGYVSIELKDNITYVGNEKLKIWLENVDTITFLDVLLPAFNEKYIFENILVNSYRNLCTPYGIENDYRIKDILEPYLFIIRHNYLFDDDYISNNGYEFMLAAIVEIFKEFFMDENFRKIPLSLQNLKLPEYNHEFMRWNSNILNRLFDKKARIFEHDLFRYNNYTTKANRSEYLSQLKTWTLTSKEKMPNEVYYSIETIEEKLKFNYLFKKVNIFDQFLLKFKIAVPNINNDIYKKIYILINDNSTSYPVDTNINEIKVTHSKVNQDDIIVSFELDKSDYEFSEQHSVFITFNISKIFNNTNYFEISSEGDDYCFKKYII